jgi:hypothetical protein
VLLFVELLKKSCCSWYCTTITIIISIVEQELLFLVL